MAERKYGIPDEFHAADKSGPLAEELNEQASPGWGACVTMFATARCNASTWITAGKQPGQTIDQWARHPRIVHETRFRENFRQIEAVYRGAQGCKPQ